MKVIINGKEIELVDHLEPGEKELDYNTPLPEKMGKIDLENTTELTEEMLQELKEKETANDESTTN